MASERPPFETLEGQGFPTVRQLSVFLENRIGQLLRLTQAIESKDVRIVGLSIVDSVDFAVVRLMFDSPDDALEALEAEGFTVSVTELIVVVLPAGKRGLLTVWSALLSSEINVAYAYPLMPLPAGPAIALSVDNREIAVDTLQRQKFIVLSESDLKGEI
ncbi:MAG: amino acid-binding protein [Phycisphaerae bacterium]